MGLFTSIYSISFSPEIRKLQAEVRNSGLEREGGLNEYLGQGATGDGAKLFLD